ncbi:YbfB/YjiJ family MFS transporter [Pantoea sp. A4]|uniref:YbfB/YjiJ family MFS transporter n=1 Tax=Pantoea sp. A4 TaxID=1225184 RepID=UPI000360596E|nr:YbfB/YjiJ family MFS transporter [Pantoea sp. A4]
MLSAHRFKPEHHGLLLALAGCVVLIIGMGYGRFAYTGILPRMLSEGVLTLHQANLAASANYAGYLAGALLLAKLQPQRASLFCRLALLGTIAAMGLLAVVSSAGWIITIRGLAGVFSAFTLVAGSQWLLQHMKHMQGAPLLFSGVGAGIFISAELISLGKALTLSSYTLWGVCALSALVLLALVFRLFSSPANLLTTTVQQGSQHSSEGENSREAYRLLAIYGLAGFGYIITATYLPLFLSGSLKGVDPIQIWAVFGLAAVPSCFIWHRLVARFSYRPAFTTNLLVQAVGVSLPAFSQSLLMCLASALLVGFTFMGTVTIALSAARRLAHVVNFNMIAAMTALYGIGQIVGPLLAGALYSLSGSFASSLFSAAAALFIAALLTLLPRSADGEAG